MNRVLVVFSDGLLSELDSARHETPRSAWIRRAVEERLAREATAPLEPDWKRGEFIEDQGSVSNRQWEELAQYAPKSVNGLTDEQASMIAKVRSQVSVAQQEEQPSPKRQVRGSNPRGGARKDSPVADKGLSSRPQRGRRNSSIPQRQMAESSSSKSRKPKTCPHANTIRKLGMPFCQDCGEFVNG